MWCLVGNGMSSILLCIHCESHSDVILPVQNLTPLRFGVFVFWNLFMFIVNLFYSLNRNIVKSSSHFN